VKTTWEKLRNRNEFADLGKKLRKKRDESAKREI